MPAHGAPDITVVVPMYNAKPYLAECLDSILSQQGASFEVIIVDDGSTDGSGDICDQYRNKDSRVRVLHTPNSGTYPARNKALDLARGKFLTFIDADDSLKPDALADLLRAQRETDADFTRGWYDVSYDPGVPKTYLGGVDSFGQPKDRMLYIDTIEGKPRICFFGAVWAALIRLDLLRRIGLRFRDDILSGGDAQFCLRLAGIEHKYRYLDREVYNYRRQTTNSLTSTYSHTKERRLREAMEWFDIMSGILEREYPREVVDQALGNSYISYIIRYLVVCGADSLVSDSSEAFSKFEKMFRSPMVKRFLPHYSVDNHPGKSKWLPRLMRLGLPRPAFWLCKHKARQRYRRELGDIAGRAE